MQPSSHYPPNTLTVSLYVYYLYMKSVETKTITQSGAEIHVTVSQLDLTYENSLK